jgi:xanthine dehydrogenase large subunit
VSEAGPRRFVGRALPHESAEGHVTGAALYVDDLAARFPNLAHAWPVQSPHAHARAVSIDVAAALATPGVLDVLTARDVPGENDIGPARRDEPLIPATAEFFGHAVAWVVAETEEAARAGTSAVSIEWEPLPAIVGIEAAIAAGSFLTEPLAIASGDAAAAIASAPHHIEGELFAGAQEHFYLETQCAIAASDGAGGLIVHSSTQHPSETQAIVARVLGVPKHRVVVECVRMGGAFGGKEVQANAWAAIAALAAQRLRRPVRVRLTRDQDFVMTGKRHPFLARFRAGCDGEGRLLGVEIALWSDGGWCLDLSEPVMYRAMFHADNCYRIPHLAVTGRVCRTHTASSTAFRGFGGPQGMLVIEEILDRVARATGVAPRVVRERNFYREGDATHYGQPVRDAARIERVWAAACATSDLDARERAIREANTMSAHRKRGIAVTPVKFGISFTTAWFNQAGALVLVYQDGSVQVNHGGTEMGQGLHTKIGQIAADALGVPLEAVRVMPTRTDKVPNTSATAASSGSDLNGAAVLAACETIRARLAGVAARMDAGASFADVVRRAYLDRVPLFATGYYRTPDIHFDKRAGRGKPFHYFAYGAAVAEVVVDGFTGQYEIVRADLVQDAGDSLSPLVDRGQVEGAFAQGVGWLTSEEVVWAGDGRLLTRGASTYKLPASDFCRDLRMQFLERAAEPGVVRGSKAVGEPPLMLAISVREALRAAIAAFGEGRSGAGLAPAAVVELASPATPEAVYFAIEGVRARAVAEPS